jgi:hypothetical protein
MALDVIVTRPSIERDTAPIIAAGWEQLARSFTDWVNTLA